MTRAMGGLYSQKAFFTLAKGSLSFGASLRGKKNVPLNYALS